LLVVPVGRGYDTN
jgi:hypothetical protein